MGARMSKLSLKDIVLTLDDGTRTTQEIAALAGCRDSYVRTCRQRKSGKSIGDRNYLSKPEAKAKGREAKRRYAQTPNAKARANAYRSRPSVKAKACLKAFRLYHAVPFEKRQEFCRAFGAARATREIIDYARKLQKQGAEA